LDDFGSLAFVPEVEDGFVRSLLPLVAPAVADESPFAIASNSARLSCPSLFLSALSKSRRAAPLADAPVLPPEDAEPEELAPEVLALLLCEAGDFAWLSLLFLLASFAYADAPANAINDMPSTRALNFMDVSFSIDEGKAARRCSQHANRAAWRIEVAENVPER
jgi:hypothetical protein